MVKFISNSTMKLKMYPNNCIVENSNQQFIIENTYGKYIFFAKNSI